MGVREERAFFGIEMKLCGRAFKKNTEFEVCITNLYYNFSLFRKMKMQFFLTELVYLRLSFIQRRQVSSYYSLSPTFYTLCTVSNFIFFRIKTLIARSIRIGFSTFSGVYNYYNFLCYYFSLGF